MKTESAIFAGGCFWCMEPPFDEIDGVLGTTSGYAGGATENPSYKEVCSGTTGHTEVVKIDFDPDKVTYEKLLQTFWRNIDPTQENRQFADVGTQYRTAIFCFDDQQLEQAEASKKKLDESGVLPGPVVTEITMAQKFWPAEEYHQKFYKTNPTHYYGYRNACGRDRRLKELWDGKEL